MSALRDRGRAADGTRLSGLLGRPRSARVADAAPSADAVPSADAAAAADAAGAAAATAVAGVADAAAADSAEVAGVAGVGYAADAADAPPRFAPRALVLGRPDDAVPVAAALAGGLKEQDRAAGAVLITWPSPAPPRAVLGIPAASRLAARLSSRGLEAVARGRLAWLALTADELPLAARAVAAIDVPSVLAVVGPRSRAVDALIAEHDLVVLVCGPDEEPHLETLAIAGLEGCGAPVVVRRPLEAPGARAVALAGWGRLHVEGARR